MTLPPAVIIDRDGTLASVECHKENGDIRCWHCYNGLLVFDAVVPVVAALLRSIRPGVTRIMTSGRDGSTSHAMLAWIRKNDLPIDVLFMRKPNDRRVDSLVKQEIYEQHIKPFWDVRYVIDDRPQVVSKWRELGLSVLAVTDPGIDPPILNQYKEHTQ